MKENLTYDVAVVGGGPSGVAAAIAAARKGAKTILIEQNGYLGGMLTAGGVGPQMTFHAGKKQVICGIPDEIVERLKKEGFSVGHIPDGVGFCGTTTPFDAEGMKLVLETMAIESGVELLYHTVYTGCKVCDGGINTITLYAKNGFMDLKAKVFIDASADADLATHAGVTSVYGRESDHLAQPMTMNMKLADVDREKMLDYIESNPDDVYERIPGNLRELPRYSILGGYKAIQTAKKTGEFHIDRDMVLCFETNRKGEFIVNMTRIIKKSAVDAFDLTQAEIEGRKQAFETFRFLRKYIPGFENCHLIQTGPNIGIRESRKINGVYKLTEDDLVKNVMFDDAVCMGGYPIDIHSPDGAATKHKFLKENSWYSIPYRCMITKEIGNLIVTGRCISATHVACSSIRLTPIVMALGQAAGTAAAQAVTDSCNVNVLDTKKLRSTLKADGVFLEEYH